MEACTSRPDSGFQRGVSCFSLAASAGARLRLACASKQRSKAWKAAQASSSSAGGPGKQNEQDGNVLEDIAALLGICEQLKAMIDSSSNSGVGPDMRNRVDHLLNRVRVLKQSAERCSRVAGSRVPSQLIASLKALQREHGSVENIVRLATQAGPVLTEQESNNQENSGLSVVAQKGTLSMNFAADAEDVECAQGQGNESPVEVLSGPKYVMSTPFSEGSFKFTAVRAEIERRVMEQLLKKQSRQSIFDSKEDFIKEHESKSIEFQKVPSVKQRSPGDKSDVDNAMLDGKVCPPRLMEAQQVGNSIASDTVYNKQNTEFEARRGEMESWGTISLERHEQMVMKFEKALFDLRDQLSEVTDDLTERDNTLLALQEKLKSNQSELSEKINELSGELTKRLTAEQSSYTLGKVIIDMEEALKCTQSQLVYLGSELNKKEKVLAGYCEEQERLRQEFQAHILSLEGRLRQREVMYEGFNPQSVLAEFGSVKVTLSALQEGQLCEQSQMADWQTKVEHFERSLSSNTQKIKELTSEVKFRMREGEVKEMLKKVLDEMEKQSKKLQECIECISAEQVRTAANLGLLQEECKAHRRELQIQIEDVKDKLISLESTQNQVVFTELSSINKKLSGLQEEQEHERSLVLEAQQQMVVLEEKGLDLLRRMNENAEVQRQDVLEEVRTLVDHLVRSSGVRQGEGTQEVISIEESNATLKDVEHTGNFVNSPSNYAVSSELSASVSKDDHHGATLQGAQQVPDKGTASLEAFFSVMGHLIREELKRMDRTSAQTRPLAELHKSGESTPGLASNSFDWPTFTASDEKHKKQLIVLRYNSSWKRAFIHYRADNLGWTEVPGMLMQEARNYEGKCWKEFRIDAARLEFVMTDGQGHWDRAPNGHNYLLEKPGIFDLGAGVLKAASTL